MGVGSDFDHLIARGVASVPPDTNIMAVTSYKNINSMVSRAVASMCNGGWIMVRNYRMRQLHTFLNCDFSGYEYFYSQNCIYLCETDSVQIISEITPVGACLCCGLRA